MIDKKKLEEKKESLKRVEKLENRIIINYAIAVVAYMIFYALIGDYRNYELRNKVIFAVAGVMVIAAIVCYVLHKKTKKTKNYGHMFIAFALALLSTRASVIVYNIFGANVFNTIYDFEIFGVRIVEKLLTSKNAVTGVSWLGAIWLVVMTIYNGVLISKEKSNKKKKPEAKKTEKK